MISHEECVEVLDTARGAMYLKLRELNKFHDQYSARDYTYVVDNLKDIALIEERLSTYGHHLRAMGKYTSSSEEAPHEVGSKLMTEHQTVKV